MSSTKNNSTLPPSSPTSEPVPTSTGYGPNKSYNFLQLFKKSGVSVDPFKGDTTSFDNWKTRMEIVFESLELSKLVAASEAELTGLTDREVLDRRLHDVLVLSVSDTVLSLLKDCQKSGWKMWNKLEAEYNRTDVAAKYQVLNQLLSYKYRGKGITSHCDEVIALMNALSAKGVTIDSDLKVCILLFSLPAEFSTLVTTLGGHASLNLTVDVVRTRAIAEEMRLRRTGSDLVLYSNKGHQNQLVKGKKRKGAMKVKGNCFKCGKPGHFARNCLENDQEMVAFIEEVPEPATKKARSESPDVINLTEKVQESLQIATTNLEKMDAPPLPVEAKKKIAENLKSITKVSGDKGVLKPKVVVKKIVRKKVAPLVQKAPVLDVKVAASDVALGSTSVISDEINKDKVKAYSFVIDSGASSHMIWNHEMLESFQLENRNVSQAEKGRNLNTMGVGTFRGLIKKENLSETNNWTHIQLNDVLVIPSLSTNILSVSKLCDSQFRTEFSSDGICRIRDQSGRLMIEARKSNGVFRVDLIKSEASEVAMIAAKQVLDAPELWHRRLGHANFGIIKKMFPKLEFPKEKFQCEICLQGKFARAAFGKSSTKTRSVFDLVHSDVCGPFKVSTIGGFRYYVTFIDDFSRYCYTYLIKNKSDVFVKFKEFYVLAYSQFGKRIKVLRSDNGGEYTSGEFREFLRSKGVLFQTTVPYTPQQNGVAERMNRTLLDTARCMMFGANLGPKYWGYAVLHSSYVRNRCGKGNSVNKSPYEMLHRKKPSIKDLKVFGCLCYVHVPKERRSKLEARSVQSIFLGFSATSKACIVQNVNTNRVYGSRDVEFLENKFLARPGNTESWEDSFLQDQVESRSPSGEGGKNDLVQFDSDDEELENEPQFDFVNPNLEENLDSGEDDNIGNVGQIVPPRILQEEEEDEFFDPQPFGEKDYLGSRYEMQPVETVAVKSHDLPPRDAVRQSYYRSNDREMALVLVKGPNTYQQAVKSPNASEWLQAMKEEMKSLEKHGTWALVEKPKNCNVVGCRWVLGIKRHADGSNERYKARLCAQGFTQEYGVDYEETYSPVAHFNSIRLFIALAVWFKMEVEQMDVNTAFLNGNLEEEIYMKQPPGFEVKGKESFVCKLKKSLYGLKQSPRQWNLVMDRFLNQNGFKNCSADACIYIKKVGTQVTMISLYVDDLLIGSTSSKMMKETKQMLNERFEMKDLKKLKFCLGIEFVWGDDGSCLLRQRQYILDVLKRFNMMDCKAVATPMQSGVKLTKDMCATSVKDIQEMKNVPYRSAVGSLIYLVTGTRPDIAVAVGEVSKFLENPGPQHWKAVKRILRYLKHTLEMSLKCNPTSMKLIGFSDADWAGDLDSRRSTTGYLFKFGDFPVCWKSKRQPTVALSTAEAEYMSLASAAQTAIWFRQLLADLGFPQEEATVIYEDNQGCIAMAKNPVSHERTKHIDIKYHFVRELVSTDVIKIEYLQTEDMEADILTKSMPRDRHQMLCERLGLVSLDLSLKGSVGNQRSLKEDLEKPGSGPQNSVNRMGQRLSEEVYFTSGEAIFRTGLLNRAAHAWPHVALITARGRTWAASKQDNPGFSGLHKAQI